ncbi:unnamed protein product [Cuscuta epithymum]|uniref:Arf-GAP domain-containing protein n=1 Tax=Cuscuta epithymum TaxID=186058 RepID=A0AAV0FEN0_9ASTE|nr:unnamed protein product [Cuscuta epithymum]
MFWHISKVRSVTLDTWLPEQVAFIKSIGNDKSNGYWEAELPPKYNRVGIEKFIRAKYAEKRWVPRKVVRLEPKPEADKYLKPSSSDVEKEKLNWITFDTDMENPSSSFSGVSIPDPNPNIIKSMNLPSCEPKKPNTRNDIQPVFSAPNVDYATQLFDMLFKEESKENFKKESALPEGSKCVGEKPLIKKNVSSTITGSTNKFDPGIEELIKDFSPVTEISLNVVQNNLPYPFGKVGNVHPSLFKVPSASYPNSSMYISHQTRR